MSIPAECTHIVFGGDLGGGEVWETGFWVHGDAPTSNTEANAMATLVLGMLQTADSTGIWFNYKLYCDTSTTLTYAKTYVYPAGGSVATFIGEASQAASHGSSTAALPKQIALVASLRTEEAGRSRRGRMYFPGTGLAMEPGTGSCTDVATLALSSSVAGMFSDWNASGDNGVVVVVSRLGAGAFTPVSEVIVDSVPDTQRRRRNKLVSAHTEITALTA